ncbi:MAG TPA: hypothetical protein VFQ61_27050 [Polyangiaceae bacterium]|nr:hypothetical protein [Polyangiaceae bacterium]
MNFTRASRLRRAAQALTAGLVWTAQAGAQLPGNGERIRTHDYAIDLAQTAVLAGTRATGLAGAYVALGEGIDGTARNPAAVALRAPYSYDHLDYDLGVGVTLSSALAGSDVFNSGRRTVVSQNGEEALVFVNLAGTLQLGRWGFAISTDIQEYSLDRSTARTPNLQQDRLQARFAVTHGMIGYAFHQGELLVGLGIRTTALSVTNANAPQGADESLFNSQGQGFEAGILLRPNLSQYRIGVSLRSAVTARASPEARQLVYAGDPENELFLPKRVALPWELDVGYALQIGPRPLNPRWLDPRQELEPLRRYFAWRERERERRRRAAALDPEPGRETAQRALEAELSTEAALDALELGRAEKELHARLRARYEGMERFHLLITGSLDILGPVEDAVGVESFLERSVQRSGTRVTFSPRLGLETEVIPNYTRFRAGAYIEPSRFPNNPHAERFHWTLGLDQRVLPWEVFGLWPEGSIWRVSGSLDMSRDYLSWGVALGMWH